MTKMKCEHCDIIEKKSKAEVLYEDKEIVIAVQDNVFTAGQIIVFPKEHFTILELVPEHILHHCALAASKVSVALFESLSSQGTNLIIHNGLGAGQTIPHFGIEIIPRLENDKLNFQWEPKQMMDDELDITAEILHKEIHAVIKEQHKSSKIKDEVVIKDADSEIVLSKDKDNYLLKSLRRIP